MKKVNQWFDTELEVASLGIFSILALETIALIKGVDGVMFGAAMAGIGTIIGWVFRGYRNHKKKGSLNVGRN